MKKIALLFILILTTLIYGCFAKVESAVDSNFYYENASDYYVYLVKVEYLEIMKTEIANRFSTAGGVIVQSNQQGTYVLTANHFCHNVSGFAFQLRIKGVFDHGGPTAQFEVYNQQIESDLCLLRTDEYIVGFEPPSIIFADDVDRFQEVIGVGSPCSLYDRGDNWNLAAYSGRWSGYATNRLNLMVGNQRINPDHLLFTTMPATTGQSGSGVWIEDKLFGIVVATNSNIDDNSYMVDPEVVYLFLQDNNIFIDRYIP